MSTRLRAALIGAMLTSPCPAGNAAEAATAMVRAAGPRAAVTPAAPARASLGCGRAGHHPTGVVEWTARDGTKRRRTFLVQVPDQYNAATPYSLSFVFHAAGGSSAQSYEWGLQNVAGASDTSIFVFPDGIEYLNEGIGWNDSGAGYDIPFFDNMTTAIETGLCIDKARVFATGFSWGGDFVTALVCHRGNVLRAVAINSSSDEYQDSSNYLTYQGMPCPTRIPPAVRFEHAITGDSKYPAPYFATTSKLLQHLNSCNASSAPLPSSTATTSCVEFTGCAARYLECSFASSIGHTLPANWARDTWAFFSTFH